MIVTSPENYERTRTLRFTQQGVKSRHRRKAERMAPGDRVCWYVTGIQSFAATATITSPYFEGSDPIRKSEKTGDTYPWRFNIKKDHAVDPDRAIAADSLLAKLAHVKRWPKEHWRRAFQGNVHEPDAKDLALVEPGVPNLQLSAAARESGLFFAPDPASQRVSTIGGNIGTNAGGPHALRYGSITNHILGIEMVLPDGEIAVFGGRTADLPGYDCVPFIVGSEGTLGIVTKAWVRLLPVPEDTRTFVALFHDVESGARAASEIIARGIVPAAMEMLD